MEYGLIGAKVGHSYSKIIHEQVCGYHYELHPLPTEAEAHAFMREHPFKAINVTIPYKQLVIPYCAEVSPQAKAIGAVNTVVNRDGKLFGYNTDYAGFAWLLEKHKISLKNKTVLILGTGATHRTVTAVCQDQGAAKILVASRHGGEGHLTYEEAAARTDVQVVVNATPAGMYPDNGTCLLELTGMTGLEAVADCVYNPFRTELLLRAEEQGIKAVCGFEMLVAQAAFAAEYFLDKPLDHSLIETTASRLRAELSNISVIGMPSAGKTSIGKQLAKRLNKRFVDLDEQIELAAGRPIPTIFAEDGEEVFRQWETEVTARVAKEGGQLISCGGGAVKRYCNVRALRQNGPVLFIDRPLSQLAVGGDRPLSKSPEALAAMERERRPLYETAADIIVKNDGDFETVVRRGMDACKEFFKGE